VKSDVTPNASWELRVAVLRAGALFAGLSLWLGLVGVLLAVTLALQSQLRTFAGPALLAMVATVWLICAHFGFTVAVRAKLGLVRRVLGTLAIGLVFLLLSLAVLAAIMTLVSDEDTLFFGVVAALGGCLVFLGRLGTTSNPKRGAFVTVQTGTVCMGVTLGLIAWSHHAQRVEGAAGGGSTHNAELAQFCGSETTEPCPTLAEHLAALRSKECASVTPPTARGIVGYTHFFDASGKLIGAIEHIYEYGRSQQYGIVPPCEMSDPKSVCEGAP
jgi:hypothetical protein